MDRPISKTRLLEIASNPSSEKYDDDIGQLVSWGLQKGLIDGCDGFVINPVDCHLQSYSSLDELALDYLEDAETKSFAEKLIWLRLVLKNELSAPTVDSPSFIGWAIEDLPSFTQWTLDVGSVGFVICVVIIIEGHEPVAIDYFAVHEAKEIIGGLRARGYLVSDGDVDALTEDELIALWD